MRTFSLLVIALILSLATLASAEPANEIPTSPGAVAARKKLDGAIAKADKAYLDACTAARDIYVASLQQALDAAMKGTKPDEGQWLKAEIELAKGGKAPVGDKPPVTTVMPAQTRCLRSLDKAVDDRKRVVEGARKQYMTDLEPVKRTAMNEMKDLDEASRVAGEIERAKVMEFDLPIAGNTNIGPEKKPDKVNVLRLIDLDRDPVMFGSFTWEKDELHIVPAKGHGLNTIRLPYRPPAEYDYTVEFTVLALRGPKDMNMICAAGDSSFAWLAGGWDNTGCCFVAVNGEWNLRNPTFTHNPRGVLEPGKRTKMTVSVRKGSVSASMDGKVMAQLQTDFKNLRLNGAAGVGLGVLGLWTFDDVVIHKAEVVEISGPGKVLRRLDAKQMREQEQVFQTLRTGRFLSLIDLTPRAVQVGAGDFMINHNGGKYPVIVDKEECTKYLYAHAPSSLIYDIPEGAIGFRAVGVRPAGGFRADIGQWRLAVTVDDCEVYLSRDIKEMKGQIEVAIPLPKGAKQIELRADPLEKHDWDHCIWAYPEFLFPR